MRVAFHAGQLLQPVPGGIGRYEIELLRRLPDLGAEPIAFGAGSRPANVPARVPWVDLGFPRGGLRYELWHRIRQPTVRVPAALAHAPSLAIPPVRDQPLVVTAHDIAFLRIPHVTTARGARFHQRGLDLARRHARIIVVPSEFTRRELEREGFDTKRLVVVPFGVDEPQPRDPDEVDATIARAGIHPPYVLSVGTVEPRKDFTTIARAVERLRPTHPDLTLVVVGPPGWGDVVGLDQPFVHVLGAQPWNLLDALYRRAAVYCAASLYEGFGLPAVEAMVRGTPTVATTGSALEEVVLGAGVLFAPGDVDACAAALDRVLTDADLRDRLATDGHTRAATLTWERSAEGHVRAYAQALDHDGS